MSDAQQPISPDEQVYQDVKSEEPVLKRVYSNEEDTDTSADNAEQPEIAPGVTADELSAESFPASDPPGTVPTAVPTRVPESGDATLSE